MTTAVLVALGGAAGAVFRYVVVLAVQGLLRGALPWGTLAVNTVGSAAAGAVAAAGLDARASALLLTGVLGALTTWSAFGVETVRLVEDDRRRLAVRYVAVTVVVSLAAGSLGVLAGSWAASTTG